jgi:PAS domain S-box-containing protein
VISIAENGILNDREFKKNVPTSEPLNSLSQQMILLEQTLEMAKMGHYRWDVAQGTMSWSRQIYDLLMIDPGTHINMDFFINKIHPEDRSEILGAMDRLISRGESPPLEFRILRGDGQYRWFFAAIPYIEKDSARNASHVSGPVQDISDRKTAENELKASEARLKEAQAIGHLGSWELNLVDNSFQMSDEALRIFEIDVDNFEPSFKGFLDVIHPEDREMVDAAYRASVETRTRCDLIHRLRFADGRIKYIHVQGETLSNTNSKPVRLAGTVQDITDRKQAEDEILLLDTAVRTSHSAIAIADAGGRLTFVNDAFVRLWGLTDSSDALGASAFEYLDSCENGVKALQQLHLNDSWFGEMKLRRKDGKMTDALVSAYVVRDANRNLTHHMASFTDISQIKEKEKQAMELVEKSRRMENLAALGQFSATIAHEIRNPLGAISLNFDHFVKKINPPENLQPVVDSVQHGISRIQDIIHGILSFARPQKPVLKKVSIDTIVSQSLQSVSHLADKKNVQIRVAHKERGTQILTDPNQLIQVIINLLSNAIQAVSIGGLVRITIRVGREVEIAIEDNGPGIPKDKFNVIFEPFYTTKPDGMGLGLSVVRNIIDHHGGRITVASSVGKGTKFTVFLPNPDE